MWHERSSDDAAIDVPVSLNARGYKWQAHKNKYGQDYPTNEGRERY